MSDDARDPIDPIDHTWSLVVAEWSNEGHHRAFVDECMRTARLDVAAKRYREAIRGEAVDYRGASSADAERRLAAVVKLAQHEALVPTPKPRGALLVARTLSRLAFGGLVLLVIIFLVLRVMTC